MSQPTRIKQGKKVAAAGHVTMYEGLMAAVCSSPSDKAENYDDTGFNPKNSSMDVTSLASHGDESRAHVQN